MSDETVKGIPSFLGIGTARAGTTWLHENLRTHPQLWLPPVKELQYFTLLREGPRYHILPLGSPEVWGHAVRAMHRSQIIKGLFKFRISPFWAMRFCFGRRDDRWYTSLFPKDRIAGEFSPSYMNLPRNIVEEIRELNPAMKIILMLREPVSRTWSAARHAIPAKKWEVRGHAWQTGKEKLFQMMTSEKCVAWNDYVTPVKTWRSVFGEKQVFIGFYDDLQARPRELMRSVLEFLGVDSSDQHIANTVSEAVNASRKVEMPEEFRPAMYAQYIDQLAELEQLVGGPVGKWRAKAIEFAAKAEPQAS